MNNTFKILGFCIIILAGLKNVTADEFYSSRALITATEEAILSSEISAKIISIPFQSGDRFKKNDTLVQFDCSLFEAQTEVVKSEYESAIITLKNNTELAEMRSIGLYEVELAQSAVNKAEAELEIARLNTKRCTIDAPYDGRVAKVYVNEYESIERQQPLIEIIGSGILEAQLLVSSKWLSWLVKGYPIQILVDETKKTYDATIESIGANIDPVSQTIDITARFLENHESLLPGMSGTASF